MENNTRKVREFCQSGKVGTTVLERDCCVFAGDTGPEVVTVHSAGRGSESKRVQKLHRRGRFPNVVSSH